MENGEQCVWTLFLIILLELLAGNWDSSLFLQQALLVHMGMQFEVFSYLTQLYNNYI